MEGWILEFAVMQEVSCELKNALFESLEYDNLVSKFSVRNEDDPMKKEAQVHEAKLKLIQKKDVGGEYVMSWCRRCRNEMQLSNADVPTVGSATVSEDIRGGHTEGSGRYGESVQDTSPDRTGRRGSIGDDDEQFGLFRNNAGKMEWSCFEGVLRSHGGYVDEVCTPACAVVIFPKIPRIFLGSQTPACAGVLVIFGD